MSIMHDPLGFSRFGGARRPHLKTPGFSQVADAGDRFTQGCVQSRPPRAFGNRSGAASDAASAGENLQRRRHIAIQWEPDKRSAPK